MSSSTSASNVPSSRASVRADYEIQQAGGRTILEYWIPAEDFDALNAAIVGPTKVVAEYR